MTHRRLLPLVVVAALVPPSLALHATRHLFPRTRGILLSEASKPVGLLGICDDTNSSFLKGPALAPPLIREALASDSANPYCELGTGGVASASLFEDCGDVGQGASQAEIRRSVAAILDRGLAPIVLGGDHAVSYPVIAELHAKRLASGQSSRLAILHFDAHTDTYDELEGNRFSHACPFARVSELEPSPPTICQVGIRTFTPHHRAQAEKFGISVIEAGDFPASKAELEQRLQALLPPRPAPGEPLDVYVSVDLDALDPAFAPGVSHHEPGGLTTRQLLSVLHSLPSHARVVGADCVEYNPMRDLNGVSAMVAAKITKELIGLLVLGQRER